MPHSLRAKLRGLRYKGILEDKDYKRLCHALDLEKAEQEPCEDAVSRQEVLDLVNSNWKYKGLKADVESLPSVRPQEQTGKWIDYSDEGYVECPFCSHATNCEDNIDELHYCFYCGAKMVEQKETETWHGIHAQITAPKGTFERIFNEADDDYDI